MAMLSQRTFLLSKLRLYPENVRILSNKYTVTLDYSYFYITQAGH